MVSWYPGAMGHCARVSWCGRNHLENTEKAEINDRLKEKITELYSEVKTDTKQINP